MARPKKTVAPEEVIDDAFTLSKEPIEGEIVDEVSEPEETVEAVISVRDEHIEALTKLFPRAPFGEYDDALVEALFKQHIGTTVRPE